MTPEKKNQNCFSKFEKHVPRARGYNANTLKAFFREWSEYLEIKVFVKPVSIKVFFSKSQQSNLRKAFFKKAINILSIYLHHLEDTLDKSRVRFNPANFPEKQTQKITLANSHVIIYYVYYAVNHISWISLHFLLDFLILLQWDLIKKLYWNASKRVISKGLLYWVIS